MNLGERAHPRICPIVFAGTLLVASAALAQQPCFDVKTFAGRGDGDGGPATAALLSSPRNVALDTGGNTFVADAGNARVRRIDPTGTITTVAGNGAPGIPNDGDNALRASLKEPSGVAVFGQDLYIADIGDGVNTVWRVTPDGVIHRFAGSGIATGSIDGEGGDPHDDLNDGQLAVFATLNLPARVAIDGAGNVFISDFGNGRIRRVDATTGIMSTVVAGLTAPIGVALGVGTDLFVANSGMNQILKVSTAGGVPTPFAGTGTVGLATDNVAPVAALAAPLNGAAEVAVDASGVVYIGDTKNNVIHSVTTDGLMHRLAGTGIAGADDGPGFLASFRSPGVALGPGQSLLIPDIDNNRVRRFDPGSPSGTVSTIAGGNNLPGDGGLATAAVLDRPAGLAIDAGGNVLITEHDSHRVRRVDTAGLITTVVNKDGLNDSATDGVAAINSPLKQPTGVALDGGNMLIADAQDHRVLMVDTSGVIRTFAGTTNVAGFAGDGGPATSAQLNTPLRMAIASDGSVFIADFNNNRVRKVDASGTINTFVGNGGELNLPSGLVFDGNGNLYVADFGSNRVLKVDASASVSLVAGSGTAGRLGDNGPASAAQLDGPTDLAFAHDGSLLVVDQMNSVVRAIAPASDGTIGGGSTISTLLGSGTPAFADGAGTLASFLFPTGIAVDGAGDILIADRGNQRVRIATPGSDCAAQLPCTSAADCDDNDPCTVDACGQNSLCTHTPLPADQCQPSCAAEPAGCIAGGGPRRTDCLAMILVKGLKPGQARTTVRCRDGDSSCDFDSTKGRCTFRLAWCLDEPGCSASGVTRLTAHGPAASTILQGVGKLAASRQVGGGVLFQQPFTAKSSCSELMSVTVNLRKHGRKPGKLQINTVAFGTGHRQRDPDKVRLICTP
jgi:sugar lactone lactonase YvrE